MEVARGRGWREEKSFSKPSRLMMNQFFMTFGFLDDSIRILRVILDFLCCNNKALAIKLSSLNMSLMPPLEGATISFPDFDPKRFQKREELVGPKRFGSKG